LLGHYSLSPLQRFIKQPTYPGLQKGPSMLVTFTVCSKDEPVLRAHLLPDFLEKSRNCPVSLRISLEILTLM
jgi:hypothetical protein